MGVGADIAENIFIIYVTINKQSGLILDDPQSIHIRNLIRFEPAFSIEFATWWDHVPPDQLYSSVVLWQNRKLFYHYESSDFRNHPCRTFAVVPDGKCDTWEDRRRQKSCDPVFLTPGGGYLETMHLNVLDEDMRPFDIQKRSFRNIGVLNGDFPKPGSRTPKSECKDRKQSCREGRDCPLVRVSEISSTGDI